MLLVKISLIVIRITVNIDSALTTQSAACARAFAATLARPIKFYTDQSGRKSARERTWWRVKEFTTRCEVHAKRRFVTYVRIYKCIIRVLVVTRARETARDCNFTDHFPRTRNSLENYKATKRTALHFRLLFSGSFSCAHVLASSRHARFRCRIYARAHTHDETLERKRREREKDACGKAGLFRAIIVINHPDTSVETVT